LARTHTTSDIDGATTEVVFGEGTKIGTTLSIDFPTIHNNSALLWLHAHPMFTSLSFIYAGVYGLVDIVDEASKNVTNLFHDGDNRLCLKYQDLDLNADGTSTQVNLTEDENRACFGAINGVFLRCLVYSCGCAAQDQAQKTKH